ncbi:hypothetical protein QA811_24100 [Streptomyces sp. B21-102]|uniref:hypothetical protein n=1 Tax=unclassified Streptomyces TaxID=2593676 RepID=UPI002FEF856D
MLAGVLPRVVASTRSVPSTAPPGGPGVGEHGVALVLLAGATFFAVLAVPVQIERHYIREKTLEG